MTLPYSALPYTQPLRATAALIQYALFKSGPTLSNGLEAMAFFKTRPALEYPDFQYHFLNLLYEDHGRKVIQRNGFMASATVSRQRSRGSIQIASSDQPAATLLDPTYFAAQDAIRTPGAPLRP